MHLDVLQSVLLDVADTQVGVLLDLADGGNDFTGQQLDQGRLAGTVGADDGDTRRQSQLARRVRQRRRGSARNTGRGELELDHAIGQGVVALGLGVVRHERGEVALVVGQLLAGLVVVDIGGDLVEEARVVGHDQTGDLGVGLEVGLEPGDVGNIQVVRRLVQQQDVGLLQHGTRQRQLHLPTTGQRADLLCLAAVGAVGEAELEQNGRDALAALLGDGGVLGHKVKDADLGILALVVLDVAGAQDILGREALELTASNASHQSRLAGTVATDEAVAVALEQAHVGVGQQKHAAVAEREVGIDDLDLAVVFLLGHTKLALVLLEVVLLDGSGNGLGSSRVLEERAEVRGDAGVNAVNVAGVGVLGDHGADVGADGLEVVCIGGQKATGLLDLRVELDSDVIGAHTLDRDIFALLVGGHGNVHDTQGTGGHITDLGERGAVSDGLDTGLELGQESTGLDGVVDQLGQVLSDDHGLAQNLLGSCGCVERALEEGSEQRKHGRSDNGNERGVGQGVDGLLQALDGGVLHGVDEQGHTGRDIVVGQQRCDAGHGDDGLLLDLGLEVAHHGLDNGDERRELGAHEVAQDLLLDGLLLGGANLHLGLVGHALQQLESADGALPLAGALVEVGDERGQQTDDERLGAQVAEQGIEAVLGSVADHRALISKSIEGHGDHAAILQEEGNLAGGLLGGEALKEGTKQVLG
ncbi:hypothetical protein F503_00878 [Ophiostoma piceae UAMH 11346]|uniref:Uncharacterized protein n=1 Tax=Ophiostoma piceae (strain UAMH 11346) TaxID=1262450 RepID=S3D3Z6_OPHP1|nr:hypothetical protein F503_00878 [Ophiostoma piceae UAMH 11346]